MLWLLLMSVSFGVWAMDTDVKSSDEDNSDPEPDPPESQRSTNVVATVADAEPAPTEDPEIARLSSHNVTEWQVDDAHFGLNIFGPRFDSEGNAVNTLDGTPTERFEDTYEEIGASDLRFLAGDPNAVFGEGMLAEDGGLPEEVIEFFSWAEDHDVTATIVLPTHALSAETNTSPYAVFDAAEMQTFVELVLDQFGDHVSGFEIGNEYWNASDTSNMDEREYGLRTSAIIDAINAGIEQLADGGSTHDPDILVQMASPRGVASAFHISAFDDPDHAPNMRDRIEMANQLLFDSLSEDAKNSIDGMVEHFYYNSPGDDLSRGPGSFNHLHKSAEFWRENLSDDLDIHITEWNINNATLEQMGMRSASTMLEAFQIMVENGVSAAQAWPPVFNGTTDLAGPPTEDLFVDNESGVVLNSIGGAVFDVMSDSLVGTNVIEVEFDGATDGLEINVYGSEDKVVGYISSRMETTEEISLDFGELVSGYQEASGILIGQDLESPRANGLHWDAGLNRQVAADVVDLAGDEDGLYPLNEHDVYAQVETFSGRQIMDGTVATVTLKPFEVIELTFEMPS